MIEGRIRVVLETRNVPGAPHQGSWLEASVLSTSGFPIQAAKDIFATLCKIMDMVGNVLSAHR